MRIRFAAVLSACALFACGGRTAITTAADSGASGSAGAEADVGAGGVDGGSDAGIDGSAGAAGAPACEPVGPLGMGTYPGFAFAVQTNTTGTVAKVQADSLALVTASGASVKLIWQWPDLTGYFDNGDAVGLGTENGWQYVASTASLAAVRQEYSSPYPLNPPQDIPPLPFGAQLPLHYANECSWGDTVCNEAFVKLAVEATTDAGVLSVNHGNTGQLAGWHVDNIYSVWKSGSMSACTEDNPGYVSLITVLGPSPINAGP